MAVKQIAEKLISENAIAIFSKSYCPFCVRAKQVISGQNVDPSKIGTMELDEVSEGPAIQDYLAEKTGQRTVPNIFISGKHIGGCDDIMRAQQSGELQQLVGKL